MDEETAGWCLSDTAGRMQRSRILAIAEDVRRLRDGGRELAPLTIGDFSPSEFGVPEHLLEMIHEAVDSRETNYPPAAGIPELRASLAEWMRTRYGVDVGSAGIVVGSGARPPLYASFRLFLEAGDGLAHGVPAWNNHHYAHLNHAVDIPLVTTAASRFLPTAEQVEQEVENMRVLILNSPLNPSGTCFTADELGSICDVIIQENEQRRDAGCKPVMLVFDQVYSTMTASGVEHVHPVQVRPEVGQYTVTLDAISKSLTATGLRLGWMAISPALADPAIALIGHMGAWPARPIQQAAARLYARPELLDAYFTELDDKIIARMNALRTGLDSLRDSGHPIEYVEPEGGIYLSTHFDLFDKLNVTSNEQIREWLLDEAGVAVVPFQAFGLEEDSGWFRISVGAVGPQEIDAAMVRLTGALTR